MSLTEGQEAAFKHITRSHGRTLLVGYAGTGKTYLMDRVASHYVSLGMSVAVTAPTHKATRVLAQKVSNPAVLCCTIHSLLSLVPKESESGTKLQRRRGASGVDVGVVIIDEASMLSQDLMKWINKLLSDARVIFVGDDAQLPPVGEPESHAFGIKSRSVLDQIVRQAEGNPILEAAKICRDAQASNKANWSFLKSHNTNKAGLYKCPDPDGWMRKAFTSEQFKDDPNSFRFLAWTNARVDSVNRKVQRWIFGPISTPFAPGELLISKKRFVLGDAEIQNSDEIIVDAIESSVTRINFPDKDMDIPTWDILTSGAIRVPIIRDHKAYEDALSHAWANYKDWPPHISGSNFDYIADLKDRFGKFSSNYAMTVHTSQGSTFKNVFLDANDILRRQRDNLLECQQLMYVALTRASDMVFLV